MLDVAEALPRGLDRFPVRSPSPPEQPDALSREILALKKKLNAIILAHNYQVPEIQDLADYVGDSLGLSRQAAKTNADVIVFCGVHFMAETAKILNPTKTVVLPDQDAGCSLEESCPADKLRAFQATNPNFYTIAYINCSAEVKALSDVICTSGNAVKIVDAAPTENCRCNECRFMKMNTLDKLYLCMSNLEPRIELSDDIMRRARRPIGRMLEISAR